MEHELSLNEMKKEWHGTLKAYVMGFCASVILTATSFILVITKMFPAEHILYVIIALALVQAICQLIYFLHLGQEAAPRWETVVFFFMVMVLMIIAFGSLWIMNDLDKRVMPEMAMEKVHD